MEKNKNLQNLSTHSECVKWLGLPEHEKYQECWQRFYQRYHIPIVNYILKRASWDKKRMADAEEIASMVYEKGFRWSFKKKEGVRFRIILKRLVKDSFSEYHRKQRKEQSLPALYEEPVYEDPSLNNLSMEILQTISQHVLKEYQGRRCRVLKWIWEHGRWPKAGELVTILEIKGDKEEKNKNAAKQWRKRNKNLWEDFQDKLRHQIYQLAIGEKEEMAEIQYFEKLNVPH